MRAIVAAMILIWAGEHALAQSQCVPLAPSQICTARFPKASQRIAIGNVIYCDGVPAATVQYDVYALVGGVTTYSCSLNVPCSNTSLPPSVLTKFCR